MGRHLDTELYRETRNASGSLSRVRELIEAGADVNRRHKYGTTPLWRAAFHGRQDVVAVLLAAGADPGIYADDKSGPLHWAAQNGYLEVVEALLSAGADPHAQRDSGYSVLAAAISHGHAAIVARLIAAGASIDHRYYGLTMVEHAERCKQPAIAHLLHRSRRQRWGSSADG